jgi:hypothetical protein
MISQLLTVKLMTFFRVLLMAEILLALALHATQTELNKHGTALKEEHCVILRRCSLSNHFTDTP